jgi:hypothetical protein
MEIDFDTCIAAAAALSQAATAYLGFRVTLTRVHHCDDHAGRI